MFINQNSLQVSTDGGNTYISLGQYLVEAQYQYSKLWADDTGRNLNGVFTGSLIGNFVKLTLQFRKLTKSELEIVAPILDSETQKIKYYDPVKKQETTIDTYAGDWSVTNKNIIGNRNKNQGFSISFIARKKRV